MRTAEQYLQDMAQAGKHIEEFTANMSIDDFSDNIMAFAAVERMILIISEAARGMEKTPDELAPLLNELGQDNWNGIKAIGNIVRHEYHKVRFAKVWQISQVHIPRLLKAMETQKQIFGQ